MTKIKLSFIAIIFIYLFIRVGIELSSNSFVPIGCGLDTCIQYLIGSEVDAASYFRAAKLLDDANLVHLSTVGDQMWYFRLWPPGMAITHYFLSSIAGGSGLMIPLYGIAVVLIWGTAFMVPLLFNLRSNNYWYVFVLITLIIASPQFQSLLTGTQLFGSEPLSLGLFYISVFLLFFSITSNKRAITRIIYLLGSGLFMGLAAYFRAVFDFVILGSVGFSLIIAICALLIFGFRNSYSETYKGISGVKLSSVGMIWSFTAFAVTVPWRLAVFLKVSPGAFTFAPAGDRIWINDWLPTSMWSDQAFPNKYGINGLCQAFKTRCLEIASTELSSSSPYTGNGALSIGDFRNQALGAIAGDPSRWLVSRLNFAVPQFLNGYSGTYFGWLFLALTVAAIVATIAFLIQQWRKRIWQNIFFVLGVYFMLTLTVAPLFMSSFEPRYFYPFIFGFWALLICIISVRDFSATTYKFRLLGQKFANTKG